jgi:hypothetical protein
MPGRQSRDTLYADAGFGFVRLTSEHVAFAVVSLPPLLLSPLWPSENPASAHHQANRRFLCKTYRKIDTKFRGNVFRA